MTAALVSAAAALLTLALLVAAVRDLAVRARPLPPQRLPAALANLLGLAAFLAGMLLGRRFWQ